MLKNRRRQEKTIVGLEMDPSHLAAAQVAVNGRISVTKGAVATLRPGILRDGEVVDPVALTEALRALFAEHELPTQVRLGIANQRIVVRTLDVVPVEDPKLLEDLVRSEAPEPPAGPDGRGGARLPAARRRRHARRPAHARGDRRGPARHDRPDDRLDARGRPRRRRHRPLRLRHGARAARARHRRRRALRQPRGPHQRRRRERHRLPVHARRERRARPDGPVARRAARPHDWSTPAGGSSTSASRRRSTRSRARPTWSPSCARRSRTASTRSPTPSATR